MQGNASGPGLAGGIPSGRSPGGSPATDLDPATPAFRDAEACLTRLINDLRKFRDDINSTQVLKVCLDLKKIQLSRRKEIAEKQADQAQGGGPMAALGNSTAMGAPQGGRF